MVPTQGLCIMRIMHFEAMHYEQFNCIWTSKKYKASRACQRYRTGTGIPAVFPKRVTRVRVRYWILAHHTHCVPIPRCHGYSRVNYLVVVSFFMYYFYCYFSNLPLDRKWSEFQTPTNATNCCVCFHLTSHSINSKREPFGPTYGCQEQGEEGGKGVK